MRTILNAFVPFAPLAWRSWAPPLLLTGLSCFGFGGSLQAGEIRAERGAASLGSLVNGGAACHQGHCAISGGTRSGSNLFHRFSHFDTRGSITGVSLQNGSASAVVLGVTNPLGMVLDKTLSLQNPASLFVLSPGGVRLGGGAGFINAPQLQLSTATGLRVGQSWFDVANTTATAAAGLSGALSASALDLSTNPGSLAQLNRDGNGDIVLQGGLLTIDQDLFLDSQAGDVLLDQVAVCSEGGTVRAQGQSVRLTDAQIDMSSSAATGGNVDLLGGSVVVDGATQIRADGSNQAGVIRIGGDAKGANPDIRTASTTFLGEDVVISANGLDQGDGGRIIVWSDDNTAMLARLEAQGGAKGGDGGFIETSSAGVIRFGEVVPSTYAALGEAGTWLLDPFELVIRNCGGLCPVVDDPERISYIDSAFLSNFLSDDGASFLGEATARIYVQEGADIQPNLNGGTSSLQLRTTSDSSIYAGVDTGIDPEIRIDGKIGFLDSGNTGTLNLIVDSAGDVVLNSTILSSSGVGSSGMVDITARGIGSQLSLSSRIFADNISLTAPSIDFGLRSGLAGTGAVEGGPAYAGSISVLSQVGDITFSDPSLIIYGEVAEFVSARDIQSLAGPGGVIEGSASLSFSSNQVFSRSATPPPADDREINLRNLYLKTPEVSFEGGGSVIADFHIDQNNDNRADNRLLSVKALDASASKAFVTLSNGGPICLGASGSCGSTGGSAPATPTIAVSAGSITSSTRENAGGYRSIAIADSTYLRLVGDPACQGKCPPELSLNAAQIYNAGKIEIVDATLGVNLESFDPTNQAFNNVNVDVAVPPRFSNTQPVFLAESGSEIILGGIALKVDPFVFGGGLNEVEVPGNIWLRFDGAIDVNNNAPAPLYLFDPGSSVRGNGEIRALTGSQGQTRFASGSVIAPGTESSVGAISFRDFGAGVGSCTFSTCSVSSDLTEGLLFETGSIIEVDVSGDPLPEGAVQTDNENGVKFDSDYLDFIGTTPWFYEGNDVNGPAGPTLRVQLLEQNPSVPADFTFLSALRGFAEGEGNNRYFEGVDLGGDELTQLPRVNLTLEKFQGMSGGLAFGSLGVDYSGPFSLGTPEGGGAGGGGGSAPPVNGPPTSSLPTSDPSQPPLTSAPGSTDFPDLQDPLILLGADLTPPQIILADSDSPSGFSGDQDVNPVLVNESNVDYDITVGLSDSPRLEDDLTDESILTSELDDDLTDQVEQEGDTILSSELDDDLTDQEDQDVESILSSELDDDLSDPESDDAGDQAGQDADALLASDLDDDLSESEDDDVVLTQAEEGNTSLSADLTAAAAAASRSPVLTADPSTSTLGSSSASAPVLPQQALDRGDAERSFNQAQLDQARDVEATLPEVRPPDGSSADISPAALAERLRQVKQFIQGRP